MICNNGFVLVVFFFQLIFCNDFSWSTIKSKKQNFIIRKESINEERVNSARVRGNIGILADSSRISFFIDWGEFANISDANIYYHLNSYGFWEENWEMSNNGHISFSPDPKLMILEILSCDSIIIGIRPKNKNEIRYIFDTKGLSSHLKNNISFNNLLSNSVSDSLFIKYIEDKNNIDPIIEKAIMIKRDTRTVRSLVKNNKDFFFKPIWFDDNVIKNFSTDKNTNNLFYFNRWLKRKGVLFTDKDIRIAKYFKQRPDIITYDSIISIESKGNSVIGYRIHINNYYIASFPGSKEVEVKSLVTFVKNRILELNKI